MSLKVAIGQSEDPDTLAAIGDVVRQCTEQLGGKEPHAALLLLPIDADHQAALVSVREAYGPVPLIGCSTDASGGSAGGFVEDGVALLLFSSDTIRFSAALARGVSKDPVGAARAPARDALAGLGDAPPRLCLTLPESLTTSAVSLLTGLQASLGDEVPIFGGTATDRWRFGRTVQLFGGEVLEDALPLLLLGGELPFAHGIKSGWRSIGKKRKVTRAVGHVVHELDGSPALDLYRHYLGAHLVPSGEWPVAVFEDGEEPYLRAPLAYDESAGSISFAGDVPEGAMVQLTEASRDDILAAARDSITEATERLGAGKGPELALFISCAARRELLGTRTSEELVALKESLPERTPVFGFYAYGELCPLSEGGRTRFHNETFVTLLLGQRKDG